MSFFKIGNRESFFIEGKALERRQPPPPKRQTFLPPLQQKYCYPACHGHRMYDKGGPIIRALRKANQVGRKNLFPHRVVPLHVVELSYKGKEFGEIFKRNSSMRKLGKLR
jgi:hypothetical protein